jgi:hypothetical protein
LFELTFEWLTSQTGCHTTTETKPEVLPDINTTCVHVVLKLRTAFVHKKTTGVKTTREDKTNEMVRGCNDEAHQLHILLQGGESSGLAGAFFSALVAI